MTAQQPQHDDASVLKPHHIRNLILILRQANAHYSRVAASVRRSLRPTHHAKMRAQRLGLGVNTEKAVALAHKHVSVIPLPILDIPTPAPDPVFRAPPARPQHRPMWGIIPLPDVEAALDVPADEGDATEAWDMEIIRTGEISPLRIADITTPLPDAPGSGMSISSDSDVSNSSGLPTPADAPIMIRIKRKSAELAMEPVESVEKRPRFLRKSFAQPLTQQRIALRCRPPVCSPF
ncbi:hypothetical protein BD779DRAFT_1667125 [Infundibulicybe gibba]|nr:hypothetical protein BD779DRAFT_1667125 [Infundibulicybe gibba]